MKGVSSLKQILFIFLVLSLILAGCSNGRYADQPVNMDENSIQENNEELSSATHTGEEAKGEVTENEELKIAFQYLTNPGREFSEVRENDEFYLFQLPKDENNFLISFNKPINQESVEQVLREHLGDDLNLEFAWRDEQNLLLSLSGEESERKYLINCNGALDRDGNVIKDQPVIPFAFVTPKAFYAYNFNNGIVELVYSPKMNIAGASLSRNKEFIRFQDKVGNFMGGEFYDSYLYDMKAGELRKWNNDDIPQLWMEAEAYRTEHKYTVYDTSSPFAKEEVKNLDFKQNNAGILFSPNGDKVAVFTGDYDITNVPDLTRYSIDLSLYDMENGQLIRTYPALFTDIFEHDGTDAHIDEYHDRYLHYKAKFAYWYDETKILVEYLTEDEAEMRIGILDLGSGDFNQILSGYMNPILSPKGEYFVAKKWRDTNWFVFDMVGNQIDTIKNVSEEQIVWSDLGVRLAYKDQDENLMIYDLEQNQSRNIGSKMDVVGWLDQETLLIYK